MRLGLRIGWAEHKKTGFQAQDFARPTSPMHQQRPSAVAAIRKQLVNDRLIEQPAQRRQLERPLVEI